MPQPSGRFSSWRTGKGLVMSKRRKRTRAMRAWRQSAGLPSRAIHWPATSSMTTNCGSWRPDSRATMVAAGMPRRSVRAMPARRASEQSVRGGMERAGVGGPEEDGGDRAPGAGAGLAEARAEEGGDGPGPLRGVRVLVGSVAGARASLHGSLRRGCRRGRPGLRGLRDRGRAS